MDKIRLKKTIRVKVISMGNAETGKSCIIKRYCEKRFVSKYLSTIGIDYGVTKVLAKDREVKVNIFDMAGHPIFYEGKLRCLDSWLAEMKQEIGDPSEMEKVVFCLCANKVDRTSQRAVEEYEGHAWANSKGFHYFETSAASGDGISELFEKLFQGLVTAYENGGKVERINTTLGYTKEQIDAIQRLKSGTDDWKRLGLLPGANKDEINKAYRKYAVLLHPDKNIAPGSEEAFKILVSARTNLLKNR
ncbi:putative dnaJ-like subfamily C member 27 [Apostichopus japonicus]|uniref:Putative dnaJ-like subfamily C member 27 n=1 Tax=Stichopus japonicus TaxID=307972 RepID=A0A2G8JZK5_STIJA|nr:putative dnaJ-like subfamily C member 27 [Apostichopus japonicus]